MTSRLRVTVNGVRYPSKDAAAKAFGKCSSTVHSIARRCNISFEEALEADAGTIKGDEVLSDIDEWDSLAAVSLIASVDQLYNVTLPPNGIENAETVSDLLAIWRPAQQVSLFVNN